MRDVVVSNIEAVLQRGEKIELLVDKTESLNQQECSTLLPTAVVATTHPTTHYRPRAATIRHVLAAVSTPLQL